jgi:hypothetical protein
MSGFFFGRSLVAAKTNTTHDLSSNKGGLSVAIFLFFKEKNKKDFHYNP